jgi:hypothetical protein
MTENIRLHPTFHRIRGLTLCKVILILDIIIAIVHRIVRVPVVFVFKVVVIIVSGVLQRYEVRSDYMKGDRAVLTSIMKSSSSDIVRSFQLF